MTTWVLIAMVYFNRAGFTAEFTSKDKCEAAGKAMVEMADIEHYNTTDKYICVEK